jgi:hypothetical protein
MIWKKLELEYKEFYSVSNKIEIFDESVMGRLHPFRNARILSVKRAALGRFC